MNIAFLSSYNGSSAKAITDACLNKDLIASPVLMISNNANAGALQWADERGLKTLTINKSTHADAKERDIAIADALRRERVTLLVLSGFMQLIGPETLAAVNGRALNIHPALLPKHGGKGMYGRNVHQAVKEAGDNETGITIHRVNEQYDEGDIIAQKSIAVLPSHSVDDIEHNARTAEPAFYVETLDKILRREIAFLD